MNLKHLGLFLVGALALSTAAVQAAPMIVSVDARSGPWVWFPDEVDDQGVVTGLNAAYAYGPAQQDYLFPTVVTFASLGIAPGGAFGMLFFDGLTSAFEGLPPAVDNAGHVGTIFKDDVLGPSGTPLPSLYTPSEWGSAQAAGDPQVIASESGVFLNSLMFALLGSGEKIISVGTLGSYTVSDTDGDGIADQFSRLVGVSFSLPMNAVAISFGFNDDIFADNSGFLRVCVGAAGSFDDKCKAVGGGGEVSEPATLALLGAGLLGLAALRRRRTA